MIILNFADRSHEDYMLGFPHDGVWRVRINSDAQVYDREFGDSFCPDVYTSPVERDGLPFCGAVRLAPYGFLILSADVAPQRAARRRQGHS
jgi:1,4-alpha-glucan branching enzyme